MPGLAAFMADCFCKVERHDRQVVKAVVHRSAEPELREYVEGGRLWGARVSWVDIEGVMLTDDRGKLYRF